MSRPAAVPALALIALVWGGAAGVAAEPPSSELRRAARERFEAGDFEGAFARVKEALESGPYDPEILRLRLRIEALGGSRVAPWIALAESERRSREPGLPDARRADLLAETARLRLRVGDADGAERDCRSALALNPGNAEASFRLAEALRETPDLALPHADRAALAASSAGRRAAAHRLAGEIRHDLGNLKGARASLSRALAIDGEDLETLRAMVRLLADKPARARVFALRAERAAGAAPSWARAASLRFSAHIWLELKAYDEARACLDRALALDPDDLDALETLGFIANERTTCRGGAPAPAPAGAPAAAPPRAFEPPVLASSGEAESFAEKVPERPSWQQADAWRLLARSWLAFGERRRAYRFIRLAEEVEIGSVRTARILLEIEPDAGEAQRDLREALDTVARARPDPASSCSQARRSL